VHWIRVAGVPPQSRHFPIMMSFLVLLTLQVAGERSRHSSSLLLFVLPTIDGSSSADTAGSPFLFFMDLGTSPFYLACKSGMHRSPFTV